MVLEICIYAIQIYVKAWFAAPSASSSRHDFQLLKDIDNYKKKDTAISTIALKKFLNHLWYSSEQIFGFFNNEITVETKCKLVQALDTPGDEHPLE